MTKLLLTITVFLTSTLATAATLTYELDLSMTKDDLIAVRDICGYPEVFKMDAAAPIAPTFIKRLVSYGTVTSERIQATEGPTTGGMMANGQYTPEEYTGDYREKVYIVKQVIGEAYKPGIYTRFEMTTYGSTAAPSGFVARNELLNHHYSAELAEGDVCGSIYYKLK